MALLNVCAVTLDLLGVASGSLWSLSYRNETESKRKIGHGLRERDQHVKLNRASELSSAAGAAAQLTAAGH